MQFGGANALHVGLISTKSRYTAYAARFLRRFADVFSPPHWGVGGALIPLQTFLYGRNVVSGRDWVVGLMSSMLIYPGVMIRYRFCMGSVRAYKGPDLG